MSRRSVLAASVASLLASSFVSAADLYWDGTGTTWNNAGSWSTDPASTTPDPVSIPAFLDTAIFNIAPVTADQSVTLDGDQGALGLSFFSPGAVSITGGNANHSLLLGASGINMNAGSGAVTIGSATDGQQAGLLLLDSQTWVNSSGAAGTSALSILNDVTLGLTGPATLTLGGNTPVAVNNVIGGVISDGVGTLSLTLNGSGTTRWQLNGANTYSGETTITSGALRITNGSALGSAAGGTTIAAGAGLILDNAGTIVGESLSLTSDGAPGSAFGALQSAGGVNRWTGIISVNTDATSATGRIGANNGSTLILDGNVNATGSGQLVFQTGTTAGTGKGTIIVNGNVSFAGQRLTKSSFGDSTGTVILTGSNDYGATAISSGTLQFGNGGTTGNVGTGNITLGSSSVTLALKRSDNFTIGNFVTGAGTIAHIGTGGVTLTGANTLTGATSITGGGTLTLDFSGLATPTNIAGTGNLTLAGSKLNVLGKASSDTTSQTFASTTLNSGGSFLTVNSNGGTATNVALGAINRTATGGTFVINLPANGNVTTSTANSTAGILPAYITVGTSNWAANDGNGNIVAFSNYSTDLSGTGNLDVPAGGGNLDGAPSTIRFSDPGANTITLPGARALSSGGILVTPEVGANQSKITGSFSLTTGIPSSDLIIFQNNTAGGLTIEATIASSFTKAGDGLLTLTGGSGGNITTRINAGTVSVSLPTPLGSQGGVSTIVFPTGSTGTLQITGNNTFQSTKGLTLSGNGIVDVPTMATLGGAQSITGAGNFTKTGNGTLVFSAATSNNNYTGATIIKGGTLQVNTLANGGVNSGVGASSNDAFNLVLDGGSLKYASASAAASTDRLLTVGISGGTLDSSGGPGASVAFTNPGAVALSGTNTPRAFTLAGTNLDANIFAPTLGDNGTGATSLQKTGAGSWTLAGLNSFSGGTTISGGTLVAGANGAMGNGNVSVLQTAINLTISSGVSNAIANTATLSLAGDGLIDNKAVAGYAYLASGVNEVVGGLVLGGTAFFDPGTYGALGSGATHVFDDYFQGSGVVTLVPEPSAAVALVSGLGVLIGMQRTRRRR